MIKEKDTVYGMTLVWSLAAVFGGQVHFCVVLRVPKVLQREAA